MKQSKYSSQTLDIVNHKLETDLANQKLYQQRSQIFLQGGNVQSSIADLSKSIFIKPSPLCYIKRAQLYASKQMFMSSISDYEQAISLYSKQISLQDQQKRKEKVKNKQDDEVQLQLSQQQLEITKTWMNDQICVQRIADLKEAAQVYERTQKYMVKDDSAKYSELLANLLRANQRLQEKFQSYENKMNKQFQKQQQEQQYLKQLLRMKDKQLKQMQQNFEKQNSEIEKIKDYESIFYYQIEQSTVSLNNKEKFIIYYRNIVACMEKYYLAARVLGQFDQSSKIKFEDYCDKDTLDIDNITDLNQALNTNPAKKKKALISKDMLQKVFKVFDKNSKSLDKVGDIVKQLPYLGTAFKILKSLVKGFDWFSKIKQQNQCQNILLIRSNITSFNQLSMCIAYYFYKNYKVKIAMTGIINYQKNIWQRVTQSYKTMRKKIRNTFANVADQELALIKQMAEMHASILMVGIAYKVFVFPQSQFPTEQNFDQVFKVVDLIQQKLSAPLNCEKQQEKGSELINSMHSTKMMQVKDQEQSKIDNKNSQNGSKCTIY